MTEGAAPPRTIFIVRHGEKHEDPPPPHGVTIEGMVNDHSLRPLGWQRAGGLVGLFAPSGPSRRSGILTPTELFSPGYATPHRTAAERTYQTIFPLSKLLGLTIDNAYVQSRANPTGPSEAQLGGAVAAATTGVTLICWEHTAIHEIANAIVPLVDGTVIPQGWPAGRFDVVWSFARAAGSSDPYVFTQIPQMLLVGDEDTPIPA